MNIHAKYNRCKHHYMTKRELAQAYAPDLTISAALKRLKVWLEFNPKLNRALKLSGYVPCQKNFSKRQIDLIYKYLGEP